MEYSIFYSWQSDAPDVCNRNFIRQALDDAVSEMATIATVEDSPRVESGMEGIAGTPEVATMMFTRIDRCAIFIGDMTLVGEIHNADSDQVKRVPNPNVLLEMGYAAGIIGWSRIICVMNEHFGERMELPFDVRNRRFPIDYDLAPGDRAAANKVRNDLARWLKFAIETVGKTEYAATSEAINSLDIDCLEILQRFGPSDYFVLPKFPATVFGQLDTSKYNAAVVRLLGLRLLKADVDANKGLYAYHWTYLGKQVLLELEIRSENPA